MASARSDRRRKKRAHPRRASRAVSTPSATTEAETSLLTLARELTAPPLVGDTAGAVQRLAAAYAPDAPLPRAVARAWIQGRENKTAALALAWARENVRLALEEILTRAPRHGALPGSAETRSRLLLAAAEAIAHEPPEAVADRVQMLLALSV
jgi:hypothetical protein